MSLNQSVIESNPIIVSLIFKIFELDIIKSDHKLIG